MLNQQPMNISLDQTLQMMTRAGIRPSAQRIAVLRYVAESKAHPTVDAIFSALSPEFPSLSRTTVYNSVHALSEAGLLRELDIEAGAKHYDLRPQPRHGHFRCRRCGAILDIPYPAELRLAEVGDLEVDEVDVYAYGLCPRCKNK